MPPLPSRAAATRAAHSRSLGDSTTPSAAQPASNLRVGREPTVSCVEVVRGGCKIVGDPGVSYGDQGGWQHMEEGV